MFRIHLCHKVTNNHMTILKLYLTLFRVVQIEPQLVTLEQNNHVVDILFNITNLVVGSLVFPSSKSTGSPDHHEFRHTLMMIIIMNQANREIGYDSYSRNKYL